MTPIAEASTATDLLARVRGERAARDAADARLVELAVAWAHAHPDQDEPWVEDADSEWFALPSLRWDAAAPFAAANAMSTTSGRSLIRDALILRHRLPRLWRRLLDGEVQAWRARRVAQAVIGQPDDVAAYVDLHVAPGAQQVGPVILERLLDEALLRLHAEERELDQLAALEAQYVRLDESSISYTGLAEMQLRGEWADLAAFNDAVTDVSAALARQGSSESLDVRRAMAVGILADPARAQALLDDAAMPAPKRRIALTVHLSEANLLGLDPVCTDADQRPLLDEVIRRWCGRDDVRLTVQSIRDLDRCPSTHDAERYRPSAGDLAEVAIREPHCVFPYCTRPTRRCDCDHIVAFARGGPTCPCNLAPLCRHHHRLKTHAGWRYTTIESGVYLWADVHGQSFVTDRDGTRDVTPPGSGLP